MPPAIYKLRFILIVTRRTSQTMRYEPVNDFRIADAAHCHDFRIHADIGEARNGIQLIEQIPHVRRHEEIDTRHTVTTKRPKGPRCNRLNFSLDLHRQVRRNFQRRAVFVDIFGVIAIKPWLCAGTISPVRDTNRP